MLIDQRFRFGFEGMSNILMGRIEDSSTVLRSNTVFLDSSMVEHTAVNRGVVGSSPTRGVWRSGLRCEKRTQKEEAKPEEVERKLP